MPVQRPTFSESWYRVSELTPRLLAAVKVYRQHFRGRTWYVLQDRSSNQFFRLNDPAYYFVAMLDGRRSVRQVWHHCVERWGDAAPTQGEVIQLLGRLHASNLLQGDVAPDAEALFKRYQKQLWRKVRGYLANLFFIRVPLWNPNRFLDRWGLQAEEAQHQRPGQAHQRGREGDAHTAERMFQPALQLLEQGVDIVATAQRQRGDGIADRADRLTFQRRRDGAEAPDVHAGARHVVRGTAGGGHRRDADRARPAADAGRILDVVAGTTRKFPPSSECLVGGVCGAGMLDAGAALGSVLPGGPPPANAYPVVEYYRADLDHYFITADPAEKHALDAGVHPGWARTGESFKAYAKGGSTGDSIHPVCRYYSPPVIEYWDQGSEPGANSHCFSADATECVIVFREYSYSLWRLENDNAFQIALPD